jgi:asparagine synthetase B (glutamine-hydrolysing)
VSNKTAADFAPPRWLFSQRDGGDSMFGYERRDFDAGPDNRAVLFTKTGDEPPQIARLGNLTAIFDGQLYDPVRLAQELGLPASPESSRSEAQLLLECYRARKESFFPKLRGMFAFVLWDAEKDELFCVRDPLGYYPCFYAQQGGNLLVSTSVRVLLDHPGVSSDVNRLILLDYFFDIWARLGETFYAGVQRVPPGHALHAHGVHVAPYRFWNPLPAGGDGKFLKADELGRFEETLTNSVNRCLERGPVGIYLSGGMDSVSVAAIASQSSRAAGFDPPHALSLVFPGAQYNESAVQAGVARQLGLPQDLVPLEKAAGPEGLFGAVRELSREFVFPIQNIWLPAYGRLTLLAKQRGIRTILTGTGGDEWLGVTPLLAADLIRGLRFRELLSVWRSIGRTASVSAIPFAWNLFWVYGLRSLIREEAMKTLGRSAPGVLGTLMRARRARKKPRWIDVEPRLWAEFLRRLEECETDFRPLEGPHGYYFGDILRGADHPVVSWEMEENFENARRLGVRVLHPYVDAGVVEILCAVPPQMLLRGGATKGLVREILTRRFPGLGFEKQKKIVIRRSLPRSVLGDGLRLWRERGKAPALPALGVSTAQKLDAYLTGALQSKNHHDTFRAWQVVTTEHWLRSL